MASLVPGKLVELADKVLGTAEKHPRAEQAANAITTKPKYDPSGKTMQAVTWAKANTVAMADVPVPIVTDDKDVIVKVTSTAICGSDLHLYLGNVPGMESGQILGHEPMGIVESVGPAVRNVKPGDRVVVSFAIACGECYFCKKELFSCCDMTNPSIVQEKMFGQRTSGLLGHPAMMANLAGGQAEYLRVPFGDVNCLVVPPASELPDEKVLFLSDILPTAWNACELASVGQGDICAIYGCGPVGLLAAQCAFARGARRVILVDNQPYRLEFAKRIIKGVETVDFTSEPAEKQLIAMCKDEPGGAPDCIIEAVGMHYSQSYLHRFEMALGLETDSPEALNSAIIAVRKGGRIAAIGAYAGTANHFQIGAFMEKGLRMGTGQTPVQKWWKELLERIRRNELDPSVVITHHLPLSEASNAYKMFNDKTDNVIKVVLHPSGMMGK